MGTVRVDMMLFTPFRDGVKDNDGVDQPGAALNPFSFPTNLGNRIVRKIGRADDRGVLFQAKQGVRSKCDGAGELVACRDQDFTAVQHRAAVYGLLNGRRVFGLAVAGGSEVADAKG